MILIQTIIDNYLYISFTLSILISLLVFILNVDKLRLILKFLLITNFLSFYITLYYQNLFDYTVHLPLHLCYLTEFLILISVLFNIKILFPLLILNSFGGGIAGLTNLNLTLDSSLIEFHHFYLSHFNLLFFSLIQYKLRFCITNSEFYKAFIINGFIFFLVIIVNQFLESNYWFTRFKPEGKNLTLFLPDWPYYLLILIAIGISSYIFTFIIFLKNNEK